MVFVFLLLMECITLLDLCMLNDPCDSGMNLIKSAVYDIFVCC